MHIFHFKKDLLYIKILAFKSNNLEKQDIKQFKQNTSSHRMCKKY